jgi:hypothetical protein
MSVNGADFTEPVYWLNKVNLKTYTWKTGAELAALSNIQLGKIYRCSSTGSGFTSGNFYMRSFDDTSWIVVYSIGGWQEIIASAIKQGVYFEQHFLRKFMFKQQTAGSGHIDDDDDTGGTLIQSGETTDGRAQLILENEGCPMNMAFPAVMKFKLQLNDADRLTGRIGMGMNSYDTIPGNAEIQFGLEIDNTATTNTFWSLVTANGTTRSSLLTTNFPITQNNTFRYLIEFIPGQSVKLYVNGVLTATKTSHIPTSGIPTNRTFICMSRTKHDNNKHLDLRSLVLAFHNGESY